MKLLVTLVLICMPFFEAFQASETVECYRCIDSECEKKSITVSYVRQEKTRQSCTTREYCAQPDAAEMMSCCYQDLCNNTERVKLSLLIMLVPLISSILFI
ncbi:hypothetical protein SRHO_G00143070 [Serrasalmus rhombeus]